MPVMWKFKTKNFTVIWTISKDDLDTKYMEPDLAKECRSKVRSGEWKCFTSDIKVLANGSKDALGEASLGGSIYADPAEFRDHFGMNIKGHGSYFSDMVREAIAQARKNFAARQEQIKKEVKAKQKLLGIKLRTEAAAPI